MNEQLLRWAHEGYAPTLLYDDNGHWAISFSGISGADDPESQFFLGESLIWCDTPQEAVDAVIRYEDN